VILIHMHALRILVPRDYCVQTGRGDACQNTPFGLLFFFDIFLFGKILPSGTHMGREEGKKERISLPFFLRDAEASLFPSGCDSLSKEPRFKRDSRLFFACET
jgi:hypothetical protein